VSVVSVSGGAKVTVRAAPERVWAMVSDVTRMGEWSPEEGFQAILAALKQAAEDGVSTTL
jgi:hypothetical protein